MPTCSICHVELDGQKGSISNRDDDWIRQARKDEKQQLRCRDCTVLAERVSQTFSSAGKKKKKTYANHQNTEENDDNSLKENLPCDDLSESQLHKRRSVIPQQRDYDYDNIEFRAEQRPVSEKTVGNEVTNSTKVLTTTTALPHGKEKCSAAVTEANPENEEDNLDFIPQSLAAFIRLANKTLKETKNSCLESPPASDYLLLQTEQSVSEFGSPILGQRQEGQGLLETTIMREDEHDYQLKEELLSRLATRNSNNDIAMDFVSPSLSSFLQSANNTLLQETKDLGFLEDETTPFKLDEEQESNKMDNETNSSCRQEDESDCRLKKELQWHFRKKKSISNGVITKSPDLHPPLHVGSAVSNQEETAPFPLDSPDGHDLQRMKEQSHSKVAIKGPGVKDQPPLHGGGGGIISKHEPTPPSSLDASFLFIKQKLKHSAVEKPNSVSTHSTNTSTLAMAAGERFMKKKHQIISPSILSNANVTASPPVRKLNEEAGSSERNPIIVGERFAKNKIVGNTDVTTPPPARKPKEEAGSSERNPIIVVESEGDRKREKREEMLVLLQEQFNNLNLSPKVMKSKLATETKYTDATALVKPPPSGLAVFTASSKAPIPVAPEQMLITCLSKDSTVSDLDCPEVGHKASDLSLVHTKPPEITKTPVSPFLSYGRNNLQTPFAAGVSEVSKGGSSKPWNRTAVPASSKTRQRPNKGQACDTPGSTKRFTRVLDLSNYLPKPPSSATSSRRNATARNKYAAFSIFRKEKHVASQPTVMGSSKTPDTKLSNVPKVPTASYQIACKSKMVMKRPIVKEIAKAWESKMSQNQIAKYERHLRESVCQQSRTVLPPEQILTTCFSKDTAVSELTGSEMGEYASPESQSITNPKPEVTSFPPRLPAPQLRQTVPIKKEPTSFIPHATKNDPPGAELFARNSQFLKESQPMKTVKTLPSAQYPLPTGQTSDSAMDSRVSSGNVVHGATPSMESPKGQTSDSALDYSVLSRLYQDTHASHSRRNVIHNASPSQERPRTQTVDYNRTLRPSNHLHKDIFGRGKDEQVSQSRMAISKTSLAKDKHRLLEARTRALERIRARKAQEASRQKAQQDSKLKVGASIKNSQTPQVTPKEARERARERVRQHKLKVKNVSDESSLKTRNNTQRSTPPKCDTSNKSSGSRNRPTTIPRSPQFATTARYGAKATPTRGKTGRKMDLRGDASIKSRDKYNRHTTIPRSPRLATTARYGVKLTPPRGKEKATSMKSTKAFRNK